LTNDCLSIRFVGGVEVKSGGRLRAQNIRQADRLLSASLSLDIVALEDAGEVKALARNLAGDAVSTTTFVIKSRQKLTSYNVADKFL
jgi:hypothetical protein